MAFNTSHNATNFSRSSDVYNYGRHKYNEDFAVEHILVTIVVPVLSVIVIVVGVIGNCLVIFVVATNQRMVSTTNMLIINLAIADLLFLIICTPFKATDYALPFWIFGEMWCKIIWFMIATSVYTSIYTLVLMTIDRYMALVHPVASMTYRNNRNAFKAVCYLWAIDLLICTPNLQTHGIVRYKDGDIEYSECTFLKHEYNYAAYKIWFCVTTYLVPLGIICCFYTQILRKVFPKTRQGGQKQNSSSKRLVTKMVVVVVSVFALCWCPLQVVLILKSLGFYSANPATVLFEIMAHMLAYANSCLNPLLYAFLSDNFKNGFRKAFGCSQKQHSISNELS